MNPLILLADHIIPMSSGNPVLADGAVLIDSDGRIGAVGPADEVVTAHPGVAVRRLADRRIRQACSVGMSF